MTLNLKSLFSAGSTLNEIHFHHSVDLACARIFGEMAFPAPVVLDGLAKLQNSVIELSYTAAVTREAQCARCLKSVSTRHTLEFFHSIAVDDNGDSIQENASMAVSGGTVNLSELVCSDLLLELESVVLCSEECRGLCTVCGCDKNKVDCNCKEQREVSPFDVLSDFID